MSKPLFVQYCAADFLAGTVTLSPMAELAYRRICDMIYNNGGNLRDDDVKMAMATKTGADWDDVKTELILEGKIQIHQGDVNERWIFVQRCSTVLERSRKQIAQRKAAGEASAKARALKTKDSDSTTVGASVATKPSTKPQRKSKELLTVKEVKKESPPHPTGGPPQQADELLVIPPALDRRKPKTPRTKADAQAAAVAASVRSATKPIGAQLRERQNKPKPKAKVKRTVPDDWVPGFDALAYGRKHGLETDEEIKRELTEFSEGSRVHDRRYLDFDLAAMQWLRDPSGFRADADRRRAGKGSGKRRDGSSILEVGARVAARAGNS